MVKKQTKDFLHAIEKAFKFDEKDTEKFISDFHMEMKDGLAERSSSLKMLPAYIDKASGKEKGRYIALDLGGTNFRVLIVDLDGKGSASVVKVGKYVIPKAVMHGTGNQLFNFIAKSISKFLKDNKIIIKTKKSLGFTFSFPVNQTSITSGILVYWTKDFSATGVVGNNVVKLLQTSLKKYNLNKIEIKALANDTVGTLAAASYKDNACDIGVIFGTGTNACYTELKSHIKKLNLKRYKKSHMIINTEWGNFNKLTRNEYDLALDKITHNPNKQILEKMISGMYLGELTRFVISEAIKKKILFPKSKVKFVKGDFLSRHMAIVESDHTEKLSKIQGYLEYIGILSNTLEDRKLLKKICKTVSRRAARISAAAISSVLLWIDPELHNKHTIAIDGTMFERHPGFRRRIRQAMIDTHHLRRKQIKLIHARDGSGIGVAIVAAIAQNS